MFCKNCGKEIDANAYICPNCGVKAQNEGEKNSLAVTGFILSFFIPLAGLICSIIAHKKSKELNDAGKNFSLAGIIISVVSMIITLIVTIVYVAIIIGMLGSFPVY